jgi:chemotaxis protein MotA
MKPATGIGIAIAAGGLLLAAMMDGTSPAAFINIPAIIIIVAGTGGATFASVGMEGMKNIPSLYKIACSHEPLDRPARVQLLVGLAERARREGLLALDSELEQIEDGFTRKGLQLVVDGTDPQLVREILESEIDTMAARHHQGAEVFEKGGGFAPTMGIIGTVTGLVHVLQNLSSPASLGPSISAAFIATLLGVASANIIYLPVASRLKAISGEEVELRMLTLDGIIAIQAGENPRLIGERLGAYVAPAEREREVGEEPQMSQLAEAA